VEEILWWVFKVLRDIPKGTKKGGDIRKAVDQGLAPKERERKNTKGRNRGLKTRDGIGKTTLKGSGIPEDKSLPRSSQRIRK